MNAFFVRLYSIEKIEHKKNHRNDGFKIFRI